VFDYHPDRSSPILVNFGSRGVTEAVLLPGCMRPLTGCRRLLPARLSGDSELGAMARSVRQLELGAVALFKAEWRDLRLASLLAHLLHIYCCVQR